MGFDTSQTFMANQRKGESHVFLKKIFSKCIFKVCLSVWGKKKEDIWLKSFAEMGRESFAQGLVCYPWFYHLHCGRKELQVDASVNC